jgi:two-component system, OmpR family, response regulator
MRVLIIDDSRDVSNLVTVLAKHLGHDAMCLNVPQAAVEVAKDFQPEIVFMDLAMPGMDGYEVARQLREKSNLNGTKIIALSCHERDTDKERVAGIDGHIMKPITVSRLAKLLGTPWQEKKS